MATSFDIIKELEDVLRSRLEKDGLVVAEEEKTLRAPIQDPILDELLFGGGFPFGCLIMFTGHPGSFKSTFAASIASLAKKSLKNVLVMYLDSEGSTTSDRLDKIGLRGVKPLTGLTLEKVNNVVNTIAKLIETESKYKDVHFLVIWDSVASTPCEAELATDDVNKTIGLKARIISAYLPRWVNSIFSKYNITMIVVNQLRDKVTMGTIMQPSITLKNLSYDKTLPGGNALLYLSNIIVEHKVRQAFEDANSPYGFRAYLVEIKSVKNKYFVDNVKLNCVFSPVFGYMPLQTQFEFLKQLKQINVTGGGYWNLSIEGSPKFRLKELSELYSTNKSFAEMWDQAVKESVEKVKENMQKGRVVEELIDEEADTETGEELNL